MLLYIFLSNTDILQHGMSRILTKSWDISFVAYWKLLSNKTSFGWSEVWGRNCSPLLTEIRDDGDKVWSGHSFYCQKLKIN
jgi:hypothetical protein